MFFWFGVLNFDQFCFLHFHCPISILNKWHQLHRYTWVLISDLIQSHEKNWDSNSVVRSDSFQKLIQKRFLRLYSYGICGTLLLWLKTFIFLHWSWLSFVLFFCLNLLIVIQDSIAYLVFFTVLLFSMKL